MYLSFYGLKEEPFRLTPDPRFIHLALPHRTALLKLVTGIVGRKGVLVALGPVGTGKTTLLHATQHILEYKYGAGKLASAFLLNPTLGRNELLEYILDEFEISCTATSKPRRLLALHELLLATHRKGSTAVLIVDEAHLLSMELLEEIRLLTNIDSYGSKLLQVVLCGQPELATLLLKPELKALRQRIATVAQLRSLTAAETREYVLERLKAAGLQAAPPFTDEFYPALFRKTGGVPRLINLACDGALAAGFKAQASRVGPELLEAEGSVALNLQMIEAQLADGAVDAAESG